MSGKLRDQVYKNLNLKETGELLEIWQENDRVEWSDTAFDVMKEILVKRLGETPPQDKPIYENVDDELGDEAYGFDELELKIIDEETDAVFYDPFEVLQVSKSLEWAAQIAIILGVLTAVPGAIQLFQTVQLYFIGNSSADILSGLITLILTILGVGLQIIFTYFPLKALSYILILLMEMEFNSRPKTIE